jgi:hypothetical protein
MRPSAVATSVGGRDRLCDPQGLHSIRGHPLGVRQGTVEVIELSKEIRERLLELFAQFPPIAISTGVGQDDE